MRIAAAVVGVASMAGCADTGADESDSVQTALVPSVSAACDASTAWVVRRYYAAGSVVRYSDGNLYVAKFANPGYNPTISTYYWAPAACEAASPAAAPAPAITAGTLEVAPYFQVWGSGTLLQAKQSAGLNSATLAFAITRGTCALDAGFLSELPAARAYTSAGGRLRISFGGADGVYAEIACKSDDQLLAMMEKTMMDAGTRRLDFDVEGQQLSNTEGTARRSRVLARLQAKYADLNISFTLPTWLRGVDSNSLQLIKSTLAAGVRIDRINLMTMSFGVENLRTMVVPSTVAQASIMSFLATTEQLRAFYPGRSTAQLHAMMGMTPMIGTNDDGAVLSLADANTIARFAASNGVGFLSYWAFQRDRAQSYAGQTDLNLYSGVAQTNYQFLNIFRSGGI